MFGFARALGNATIIITELWTLKGDLFFFFFFDNHLK